MCECRADADVGWRCTCCLDMQVWIRAAAGGGVDLLAGAAAAAKGNPILRAAVLKANGSSGEGAEGH